MQQQASASSRACSSANCAIDAALGYTLSMPAIPSGRAEQQANLLPKKPTTTTQKRRSSSNSSYAGADFQVLRIPESELTSWLNQEQTKGNFRFVQCGGKKRRVHSWYRKYVCHCYGQPEVKSATKKSDISSDKTGGHVCKTRRKSKKVGCPCVVYATCDESGIALVRYYPVHRGHSTARAGGIKLMSHRRMSTVDLRSVDSTARTRSCSMGSFPIPQLAPSALPMASTTATPIPGVPLAATASKPIPEPVGFGLSSCASADPRVSPELPLTLPSLPTTPSHQQLPQPMPLPVASVPASPATANLNECVTLWRSLGYMSFSESAPFSFGFVCPQALPHINSATAHGHSRPLALALERTLGSNTGGLPLYTLVIRGTHASTSFEHLGYLITADPTHGAVQRWLQFLQGSLGLRPHTFLVDPDDIAGHSAVNLVFGHSCTSLWAIGRLESCWTHALLPSLPAQSPDGMGVYGSGRSVVDVVTALLTMPATMRGFQLASSIPDPSVAVQSLLTLPPALAGTPPPLPTCPTGSQLTAEASLYLQTTSFPVVVPSQSPSHSNTKLGASALPKTDSTYRAMCNV
ncbi:hypothetical protein GGI12_004505 [Dipsacomyces acuminosporus]|nr:hypothetical protein GGI12_004505 [Dipsacomyces acuminosporus]